MDGAGMQDNDDVSPRVDDEYVKPAAEDEFPVPPMDLRGEQTDQVLAEKAGLSASSYPTVKDGVKTRNGFHEEKLLNLISSADDIIALLVSMRFPVAHKTVLGSRKFLEHLRRLLILTNCWRPFLIVA